MEKARVHGDSGRGHKAALLVIGGHPRGSPGAALIIHQEVLFSY